MNDLIYISLFTTGIIGMFVCFIFLLLHTKDMRKNKKKEIPNEIKEHENYGYSIPEAAEKYKLNETKMLKDVENNYRKTNLEPICFFCDQLELNKCKGIESKYNL